MEPASRLTLGLRRRCFELCSDFEVLTLCEFESVDVCGAPQVILRGSKPRDAIRCPGHSGAGDRHLEPLLLDGSLSTNRRQRFADVVVHSFGFLVSPPADQCEQFSRLGPRRTVNRTGAPP